MAWACCTSCAWPSYSSTTRRGHGKIHTHIYVCIAVCVRIRYAYITKPSNQTHHINRKNIHVHITKCTLSHHHNSELVRIFVPDIGPTPPPRAGPGDAFDCSINAGTIRRQLTEIWCVVVLCINIYMYIYSCPKKDRPPKAPSLSIRHGHPLFLSLPLRRFVAHALGWWGKMVMFRDWGVCWLLSVGFEVCIRPCAYCHTHKTHAPSPPPKTQILECMLQFIIPTHTHLHTHPYTHTHLSPHPH